MLQFNWKSRTTWTGIVGLVTALGGYITESADGMTTIYAVLGSLAVIFGRAAIKE